MKLDRRKEMFGNSKIALFGVLGLKDCLGGLLGLKLVREDRKDDFPLYRR